MASTILLKRSNTAGNDAYTGSLGEVTVDTQARRLRIHDGTLQGGHVVSKMSDITDLQSQIDGLVIGDIANLQATLDSLQSDIDTNDGRITDIEQTYINKNGSVAFTGNINAGTHNIINVGDPVNDKDAANKFYVDSEISSLGNVFSYEGTLAAGGETTPLDLSTVSPSNAGSYYMFSSSGYITNDGGTTTEFVNADDAILFDPTSYRILDNTNTEISGTPDYIVVNGSTDTGYGVDISNTFKSRVTFLEDNSVYSVTGNAPISVNNADSQNPIISVAVVTQTSSGVMSASDKTKLDGVEANAQVNTVNTVNGYTGNVSLDKVDVGLGNVDNYSTASQQSSTSGNTNTEFTTPKGVRWFVEDGTYTIDGGTF